MTNKNLNINALRFLGVDMINKANSGHPGIVLGAAPAIYTLYHDVMNHNPKNSLWFNRDRFILSAGHGSGLLYATLHVSGYNVLIEDIKDFRQIGSKTPGHPEYGYTDGVETTSGPLGQGISNAVGMAIAEAHLRHRFNKPNFNVVDHYTYVLCGDGDLQEGVAQESMSLAGKLGLERLIVLFDSNDIQLDGPTNLAINENYKEKFEAIGWNHILVKDGMNPESVLKAVNKAKEEKDRPTIIELKTVIGYSTTKEGTSKTHGSPIGEEERKLAAEKLGWNYKPFEVPEEVYMDFRENVVEKGLKLNEEYDQMLTKYEEKHPDLYKLLEKFISGEVDFNLNKYKDITSADAEATRATSGKVLTRLSEENLNIIGGSADLASSTKAKGADGNFTKNTPLGRNVNYGVREHAMAAINNGIVLHGGLKAFGGAFFVFSDYNKPSIRLSALMQIPTIHLFTHDSVSVGEDGPTHQPVEQLTGLRAIPGLNVIRPADAKETLYAWKVAIESKKVPTVLVLTRQGVKALPHSNFEDFSKGAYIVSKETNKLDGVLLATGSEVNLALDAKEILKKEGIDVRVVSMPSTYMFDKQNEEYKQKVLPKGVKTLAIEAGSTLGWYKYADEVMGIDRFGASAPASDVLKELNFTAEKAAEKFKSIK